MDAPWFKKRTYLHFDNPINLEQATKLVLSPKNIISHSFYPFLSCELKVPKLKKFHMQLIKIVIFLVIMPIY